MWCFACSTHARPRPARLRKGLCERCGITSSWTWTRHCCTGAGGGCERLRKVGECLPGMRVLRQDPLECLLSFICSSNNNVARIAGMIGRLREEFGSPMAVGAAGIGRDTPLRLFSFPTLEQLSAASEERLRELGFGYRAKFVTKTVSKLRSEEFGGTAWLERLRGLPQSAENVKSVRTELQRLDGVGPKVADCVALFALDRRGAIPVDTHVWQIACRDFDRQLLDAKSLTPAVYDRVGDLFRERYGEYAGWAHCLLFAAELPLFQDTLPEDMVTEMKAFAKLEKERKAQAKAAKAGRNTSRAGKVKKETGLASAAITVAKVAKTKATSKAKRMSKEKTKTVMKAKRKAVEPAPTPAPAQRRYTRRRRT